MLEDVTNCSFTLIQIGKIIPSSKLEYRWDFTYKNELNRITLFYSKLCKRIQVNANTTAVFNKKT